MEKKSVVITINKTPLSEERLDEIIKAIQEAINDSDMVVIHPGGIPPHEVVGEIEKQNILERFRIKQIRDSLSIYLKRYVRNLYGHTDRK